MSDYPKLMQRDGEEITVHRASEQGDREAEGWRACDGSVAADAVAPLEDVVEVVADEPTDAPTFGPADDGTGEEPTEGPAYDDTHVKRSRKKK